MSTIWQLCEAIVDNGIKNTHFFNGRLLSAEDLQVEQNARRQVEGFLGEAIGAGVLRGLEVSLEPFQVGVINSTLLVRQGLAINAQGQVLYLPEDVQLAVAEPVTPALQQGGKFNTCNGAINALPSSIGIYLLALAPASEFRGSAPFSGLGQNGAVSGCGSRYEMEGVQFRLVKVNLDETNGLSKAASDSLKALINATNLPWSSAVVPGDPANLSLLRNQLAYHCYGADTLASFAADPFQKLNGVPAYQQYGLVDALRAGAQPLLAADEVPLALLYWTVRGVRFLDAWSVRRAPILPLAGSPWEVLFGQRRLREAEAMSQQFSAHLAALLRGQEGFQKVTPINLLAKDYFRYLPPVGILPLTSSFGTPAFSEGANAHAFFFGLPVRHPDQEPVFIEGSLLPGLFREALAYPPIQVGSPETFWLYRVRENQQEAAGGKAQTYIIFTNGHVPFRGEARYRLGYYNYGNYA